MKRKKSNWLRRLFLSVIALLCLATAGLFVLSINPQWLASIVQKALDKQGINATVSEATGSWQGTNYHLSAQLSASSEGVTIQQGVLDAEIALKALLNGEAFISRANISQLQANVDIDALKARLSPKKGQSNWRRFAPQAWQISCATCQVRFQQYAFDGRVSAAGQGVDLLDFSLNDERVGELTGRYNGESHQLMANSQSLNLQAISDYAIQLQDLTVDVDIDNLWRSQLQAQISDQTHAGEIALQGNGSNQLDLAIASQGKTLSLSIKQQNQEIILDSDNINIAIIDSLKPLVLPLLAPTLPTDTLDKLRVLRPSGNISGHLVLQETAEKNHYRPRSGNLNLDDVSIAYKDMGFAHLFGNIGFQDQALNYQLRLQNSVLTLPTIFSESLHVTDGRAVGSFDQQKKRLAFDELVVSNDDVDKATAKGWLIFGKQWLIDASAHAENADISRLSLYFSKKFPKKPHAWLKKALVSGKDNNADFVLKGNLRRFLKDDNFVFNIDINARDGVFHYLKNNPDIAIEKARVTIDRYQLDVDLAKGKLFDSTKQSKARALVSGGAHIENMKKAVVDIHAEVPSQPLSTLQSLAKNSVAKKVLKRVNHIADVDGTLSLDLDLSLPVYQKSMKHTFELQLQGDNLQANLARYPELVIKKAKTQVFINQHGLQQLDIEALHVGQPVRVKLTTKADSQKHISAYKIAVQADNASPIEVLPQLNLLTTAQAKLLSEQGLLSGNSNYSVNIALEKDGQLARVDIESQLQGTQLSLFDALNKSSRDSLPLTANYNAKTGRLSVDLNQQFRTVAGFGKHGQVRGLLFDNQAYRDYETGTVQVSLNSDNFDLPAFVRFYTALKSTIKPAKNAKAMRYLFDVAVENLKLSDKEIPLRLSGNLKNLQVFSPLLTGDMTYQNNHLEAKIAHMEVDKLFEMLKKQSLSESNSDNLPQSSLASNFPTLNIAADQLIYKNKTIGKAEIHTSVSQGNYSIDQFLITGTDYYLDISGYEVLEPQGMTTHIFADFKGENIRNIIALFSLNDMLSAKTFDASVTLSWPGRAHTLNLRHSYGKASSHSESVKLMNMSSGFGSVFGLMDIASILKRVSLDFQNLTSSKLFFDNIQGDWNIGGGRAITHNTYATGSVVELKVDGAIDLYRREFDDLDLLVIPKASNIIPIIGAVSGGVVGGAVGLVVQQVFGDGINETVGLPYIISGTWEKPEVKFNGPEPEEDDNPFNFPSD